MKRKRHSKILGDEPIRALQRTGGAWLMLALMLTCAPLVHALPPGGGGPGSDPPVSEPDDCADVSGTLSAAPSFIDRNMRDDVFARLTWSVERHGRQVPLVLYINNHRVNNLSGSLSQEVLHTTTFRLRSRTLSRTLASVRVTVAGDPGVITVSPGPTITQEDLAAFNAQWMQPYKMTEVKDELKWYVYDQKGYWGSENMEAMVRMYDLTHDLRYLDHLWDLIKIMLQWRDDNHTGPFPCVPSVPTDASLDNDCRPSHQLPQAQPFDPFRGHAGLPAWGERSIITGGLHNINETSFGFIHAFAAFARIVAEHPQLRDRYGEDAIRYGEDAIRYTNEISKTVRVFLPQILPRRAGNGTEATLKTPDIFRSLPTPTQCDDAYHQARADYPKDADRKARDEQWHGDCLDLHHMAGIEMAHNWNQWFMMGLIELWKTLDSHWYRNHPDADPAAGALHAFLPQLVSRLHRNFVNRLVTVGSGAEAHFFWHYNDGLPEAIKTHDEDTRHGALDMRGLEVLRDNLHRLNAAATAAGEPIVLDETHLRRFANTFLHKIAVGSDFKEDIEGNTADPVDGDNAACDGWVKLAVADVRVYQKCHEVSLRVVNGQQPYLTIGNHSALLLNKRWLPAPDDPEPTPDPEPAPDPEPPDCGPASDPDHCQEP